MSQIDLAYGDSFAPLYYDPAQFQVLAKTQNERTPLTDFQIGAALDSPIGTPVLDETLRAGQSIVIVVSDATRATASAQIINLLVRRMIQVGVSPADISIIFATGIHRPVTNQEKQQLLTPFIVQRIKTIDHDAYDPGNLINLGTTPRGTPISLNRVLLESDHVIITGGISFHYFAGFTGGRKSICPGLASGETVRQTHMLALDFQNGGRRAGVGPGLLDGNAVHEECEHIAKTISPSFSVNTVVDELGRAVAVYTGHWRESHRLGCNEYLAEHSLPITNKRKVVIASCGGTPYDVNLIQAHKALEMASYACEEGGTIVLLAECRDGLGREDFLRWFDAGTSSSLEQFLHSDYEVNGQTAWSLLNKTERFKVVLISTLDDQQVMKMRMIPARSLNEALTKVEHPAYIMPRGAALLPVVR